MVQKSFRLHVSRLPGETSHGFDCRQRNLAANIKGHGNAKTSQPVNNKIAKEVPVFLPILLARTQGEYTDFVSVFHCIKIEKEKWVGVVGDGANGSYETFVFDGKRVAVSDKGYGDSTIALLEVLKSEVQP